MSNKSVCLVTGAGGSIGSELVLQLISDNSFDIILANDISEQNLFTLMNKINNIDTKTQCTPILGDLSGSWLLDHTFSENKISRIYHAAAYKHVNLSQVSPLAYFVNNVTNLMVLVDKALAHDIPLTLISTDKAVHPSNMMGMTKRICELLILKIDNPDLKVVRFGNVLNSNGSVIPIFNKQIAEGGPVTITHRNAERFFMSISEAVSLVLASIFVKDQERLLILDMGPPHKIISLAKNLIEQAGLRPVERQPLEGELELKFIGLRDGEKLTEELSYSDLTKSSLPNIFITTECVDTDQTFTQYIRECIATRKLPEFNLIDWSNGCVNLR
jgi:FlaA1/EpsC-like NDP-sugar epimerase